MKGMPGGGMAQLMRQANQMQMKMKKMQEELAAKHYEGKAGGGAVQVKVDGDHFVKSVNISADIFKSADAEMLQDMLMAATNDAVKLAKDEYAKEMEKITGGIGMPGMF